MSLRPEIPRRFPICQSFLQRRRGFVKFFFIYFDLIYNSNSKRVSFKTLNAKRHKLRSSEVRSAKEVSHQAVAMKKGPIGVNFNY